jgi:hypothetical protein
MDQSGRKRLQQAAARLFERLASSFDTVLSRLFRVRQKIEKIGLMLRSER